VDVGTLCTAARATPEIATDATILDAVTATRAARTARMPELSRLTGVPPSLAELSDRQCGVLSRRQLDACGTSLHAIEAAVAARRWQTLGRNVVILQNGPPTPQQRQWCAVLLPSKPAALAGLSAAAAAGLVGFEVDQVHIVVRHDTHTGVPAWVTVHESRRFSVRDIHPGSGVPRTRMPRALVDAATWSHFPRRACAILCAGVQQRLATPSQLRTALRTAGRVRHVRIMGDIIGDISGGGHTLSEIDLAALARRAGLDPPRRQVLRRDRGGRARYVDAEFDLPDGTVFAVEIDGAMHLKPVSWWDDQDRQNEIVIAGVPVLRFASATVRLDGQRVVDQLARMLRAHTS
jgi:hypothetical protein